VQVVAVGVLGGALAAIWQSIRARRDREIERRDKIRDRETERRDKIRDQETERRDKIRDREIERRDKIRDREAERNDAIRAELASLVALYNDVKAVRRKLRNLGLDLETYPVSEREQAKNTPLTEEQACGFHEQMRILSGLQLGFEAKVRQFSQTDFLAADTVKVVEALDRIEKHLNRVLQMWEQRGWTVRKGTPLAVVYYGLESPSRPKRLYGLERLFRVRKHFR